MNFLKEWYGNVREIGLFIIVVLSCLIIPAIIVALLTTTVLYYFGISSVFGILGGIVTFILSGTLFFTLLKTIIDKFL